MSIPTIVPYALPAEESLPYGRAGWQLDPDRAVLLIHDMQQYFVDFFPSGQEPMTSVIRNIAAIRAAAAARGVPVVYTAQPGSMTAAQRGLLSDFWGAGMDATPAHRRMVAPLEPAPTDLVLTKWRYSAFARTGLDRVMREYGRDQLIVCGIYAHVGCLMTACDAFTRDIQPFLLVDAIADFSLRDHLMAIDYAERRCAVTPGTATVVAALTAHDRVSR
ncbi:isochorismatase family protein [Actinophytocola sp.]|uniref:isochorismatase family protein n=1 Tax=Actinophytocola sp. TaxID=1872138 RepID=UPI002ED2C168